MNESQATLHQLQLAHAKASNAEPAEDGFIHSVDIIGVNPARRWIRLSALAAFVLAFSLHQLYLASSLNFWDRVSNQAAGATTPVAGVKPAASVEASQPLVINEVAGLVERASVDVGASEASSTTEIVIEQPAVVESRAPFEDIVENHQARELNDLKQKQLDLLFRNASVALAKDRLLTPESDNAVSYFQEMLAIDKSDVRAIEGLASVAQRYKTFAIKLAKRGDIAGAAAMLEKAEFIAPLSKDFNALFSQFSSSNTDASVEAIDSSATMKTAEALPVAVAAVNSIAVSPSDLAVFDGLKVEARRLVNTGRPQESVDLLVPHLTKYATDGEFVELLHQAYLASGQTSEATHLRVTTRGVLPKHHTAKMQASELLQSGKPSEAIPILERDLPSYEQDKGYYGLLAGLYYKVQRFSDAERAYEKLLGVAPTSGSYWLGYAVALDAQQDKRALNAFRKAQILLPESDASKQYVERRVRELGRK